jgi:hypothetical protein
MSIIDPSITVGILSSPLCIATAALWSYSSSAALLGVSLS